MNVEVPWASARRAAGHCGNRCLRLVEPGPGDLFMKAGPAFEKPVSRPGERPNNFGRSVTPDRPGGQNLPGKVRMHAAATAAARNENPYPDAWHGLCDALRRTHGRLPWT